MKPSDWQSDDVNHSGRRARVLCIGTLCALTILVAALCGCSSESSDETAVPPSTPTNRIVTGSIALNGRQYQIVDGTWEEEVTDAAGQEFTATSVKLYSWDIACNQTERPKGADALSLMLMDLQLGSRPDKVSTPDAIVSAALHHPDGQFELFVLDAFLEYDMLGDVLAGTTIIADDETGASGKLSFEVPNCQGDDPGDD